MDQYELTEALPGDNIKMKIKGIDEEQLRNGFVICRKENMCRPCRYISMSQILILSITNLPEHVCAHP